MAKIVTITSKRDGFRRCGIAHSGTVEHPADKFTKEQLAALQAEPLLVVSVAEGKAVQKPDDGQPGQKPNEGKGGKKE